MRYLLLGLIQGLTEFLPISSTGHLVIVERWLGFDPPGVLLEAMLHCGTLAAILLVFREDIWALARSLRGRGRVEQRKEVGLLIAGSVPIVIVGLLLRGVIESSFSSLTVVGIGLIITGMVLAAGFAFRQRAKRSDIRFSDALLVGIAQAAAVFPGISRSGVTLVAGTGTGLTPAQSVRFSFLLAIPAILGSGILQVIEAVQTAEVHDWGGVALGTLCAFVSGWLALRAVIALMRSGRLWFFSGYCLAIGVGALIWSMLS